MLYKYLLYCIFIFVGFLVVWMGIYFIEGYFLVIRMIFIDMIMMLLDKLNIF